MTVVSEPSSAGLRIARGFILPLDLVTEATAIVATRGAGKSSTSVVVVEEAHREGVQSVILDRTGVYWGVRTSASGDGPGLPFYVLGGPHGDVPLEAHAGKIIADLVVDSGHSFVLDLSDFSKGDAMKFAAAFLEHLYDRKARTRTTTLVVIDEAHFYAPQTPRGGFKGDAAKLMGAMEDVVGLGRSRGLGVVLTTQRTQALNKAVLDLIETLLVMRMLSPRARVAVSEWIKEKHEDDELGVIASLDSLPTGSAWVWAPLRGILQKVAIRRIRTFDSYATPRPGEARVEPTARKELDLDALGEQMRATVDRAKENDPGELQRRIKSLTAALARAESQSPRDDDEQVWEERFRERGWHPSTECAPAPTLGDAEIRLAEQNVAAIEALARQVEALPPFLETNLRPLIDAMTKAPTKSAPIVAPVPPSNLRVPARVPDISRNGQEETFLSSSQQKILNALAWFEAVGVPAARKVPLAAVAGVSAKSSGFRANVSTLSGMGMVFYPEPGRVALTDAGRAAAVSPDIAPTAEGLQNAIYEMISGPQATLLRVLVDAYPGALDRETLADRAGVSALSSGFRANVSTLSGFELVIYPQQGTVQSAPLLFLET